MTAPDLAELRQLLDVDHTETDLEARARVLMRHLTGAEWDDMDPGTRSKVGTQMVRALHYADEIDPARQRLAVVLAALPHLLELQAGVRALLADTLVVKPGGLRHWGDIRDRLRALLDPAQPTAPAGGADVGRRG